MQHVFKSLLLAGALVFGVAAPANAAVDFKIYQTGNTVHAVGSGSLDLTGSSVLGTSTNGIGFITATQAFAVGGGAPVWNAVALTSGDGAFGSGGFVAANSFTGDFVGLDVLQFAAGFVFLDSTYVSGKALTGTATFNNTSIAALGLNAGVYNYALPNDTLRLTITNVPEPATWAMMIGGFGLVGASMRRSRRPVAALA